MTNSIAAKEAGSAGGILVATDIASNADLVRRLLRDEFERVDGSTDPSRAVLDFEKHKPAVLILAFDSLEKAERYYLGLYRLGTLVHALPHRTVILCNQADVRRVFELCKIEYFDDYVLFWPIPHDATRLPMAVHHALRQLATGNAQTPTAAEFAHQARRLATAQAELEHQLAHGSAHIEAASHSVHGAQRRIDAALDGFVHELAQGELRGIVEVKDAPGLRREIDRLKSGAVAASLDAVTAAVQPVSAWASALRDGMAPRFESASALRALAERVRPQVLVVDDDVFQHKILQVLLADAGLDLSFASSGPEALASLRKHRPELILMDVNLPALDGIETMRRIKAVEQFASVPVLMITGRSDRDIVMESAKAGAAGFVVKPFNKGVLLSKLRSCLDGMPTAAH